MYDFLNNFMVKGLSWKADSYSAGQEIHRFYDPEGSLQSSYSCHWTLIWAS
jgi:hypothetical protein